MAKQKIKPEVRIPAWMMWLYALVSFLIIPVFLYKPAIDVTLVPKFMILAGLLLFYVLLFLVFIKYKIPVLSLLKTWPIIFWSGFTIVSLLSLLVAYNPSEGIFDILRVALSLLYLIITASLLIRTQSLKPFLVSALLLAFGFSMVGFYEYFAYAFRHPELDVLYQIKGLMSHKNIFSSILFLLIPFLYYSILTTSPIQQRISSIALFLDISLLLLLQTRSIWLAIIIFNLVSLGLAWVFRHGISEERKKHFSRSIAILGIVNLIALLTAYGVNSYSINYPKHVPTQQGTETIKNLDKRLGSIFDTSSPNRQRRLDVWGNTLDMLKDYPVLGVGAGNWKILAPNYYQPNAEESYYHNWRRPHNDFLWVLAEKGILGILTYLAFFISLLVISIQVLRRSKAEKHKILVILMLGGLAGYCIDASFSFPYERIDIQMFLMFYAAAISWVHHASLPARPAIQQKFRVWFLLTAALLLIFGLSIGRKMVKAEVYTNYSYTAHMTQQWPTAVLAIDLGYSSWAQLDPSNNPMHWFRGHANMRQNKYKEARVDLEMAREQNPYSISTLTDLATVYFSLEEYEKAIETFQEALRIYPMNRFALKVLGMTYTKLGRYHDAVECYYRCITDQHNPELDSLIEEAHRYIHDGISDTGIHIQP